MELTRDIDDFEEILTDYGLDDDARAEHGYSLSDYKIREPISKNRPYCL